MNGQDWKYLDRWEKCCHVWLTFWRTLGGLLVFVLPIAWILYTLNDLLTGGR